MYLISVYPIIKSNWTSELQYWSAENILPGTIIKVPLRGKLIAALTIKSQPISEAKGSVKNSQFKTRKIENPHPLNIVHSEYIEALKKTSTYFVQNTGSVLKSAIPTCAFLYKQNKDIEFRIANRGKQFDHVAISVNTEDRLSAYKSIIREELARKKSILIVAPTVRTAEIIFDSIKKGIEHVSILLHGGMTKKKIEESWKTAIEHERSQVIITTPAFMSIPRYDIETIILENESSRAYRTFNAPYFDWRKVAEQYAKELNIKLVFGDQLLSLETIYRIRNYEINELYPLSYRIQQESEIIVVDMLENQTLKSRVDNSDNHESDDFNLEEGVDIKNATATNVENNTNTGTSTRNSIKKKFSVLSEELESMIAYAIKKNQNIFIFASRRGLSPQTVCNDCKQTVLCKICHAPVVLHTSSKADNKANHDGESDSRSERFFLCHHCGRERIAMEACVNCNSWNLVTLGIGTDTVFEEISKKFPDVPIFKIDKDSAKNDKEAKKIAKDFESKSGAVLIGTETALTYINKVRLVAIASMDSLFSIPDFRISERIAHIILRLIDISESYFLIQTRNANSEIIKAISSKTLADFIKEELDLRKQLNYPPYSIMGKISLTGQKDSISKQAKKIESILSDYEPLIFPALIPAPNGKGSIINILFTLPKDIWDKETRIAHELYTKLSAISGISPILINPESFI